MAVVAFLALYLWAASRLADHLPPSVWAQLAFFAAAGVLWGVPLIPLIRWMNAGPSSGAAAAPDPAAPEARGR